MLYGFTVVSKLKTGLNRTANVRCPSLISKTNYKYENNTGIIWKRTLFGCENINNYKIENAY